MDDNQFELVLQTISTGLVEKIIEDTELDEDTAIEKLYKSKLYSVLEKEKTKIWHHSVPKLYEIWDKEMETGQLFLPEF